MSVLIKGMEMPTSCVNCRFSGFGGMRNERVVCMHTGSNAYLNEVQYLDDCPLVPVPPHGDLIDADKLAELCDIMADKCDGICASIWHQFKTTVEWSPIVIPAEEGE